MPAFRVEAGRGNLFARGLYLARRLNLPILVQIHSRGTLARRISGIAAGPENSAQRKNTEVRRTQAWHEAPSRFSYFELAIENNASLRPGGPILNRLNARNTFFFSSRLSDWRSVRVSMLFRKPGGGPGGGVELFVLEKRSKLNTLSPGLDRNLS